MAPQVLVAVLQYLLSGSSTKRGVQGKQVKSLVKRIGLRNILLLLMMLGGTVYFVGPERILQLIQNYSGMTVPQEFQVQTGSVRVYFTDPAGDPNDKRNIAHTLVRYIDESKQSIDVAAYELDNKIITEALVRAQKRGVKVRLVTDSDYSQESGVVELKAAGVPVVEDHRTALMHNKFMVFDQSAVWTGSMNFTENCAYKNNNHGIYIANAEVAANYLTKFRWMHEHNDFGSRSRLHAREKMPHPVVKLTDGTVIETYFSPDDRIANKVTTLLGEAKKSIHFLAFSFTHADIGDEMIDRSKAGVEVQGVFEKTQTTAGHSEYNRMAQLGLKVFTDANPRNMHHKVIIVDGETVLGGSFNFSENADRSNDENAVIIRNNRAVAELFEKEFKRVHTAASGPTSP